MLTFYLRTTTTATTSPVHVRPVFTIPSIQDTEKRIGKTNSKIITISNNNTILTMLCRLLPRLLTPPHSFTTNIKSKSHEALGRCNPPWHFFSFSSQYLTLFNSFPCLLLILDSVFLPTSRSMRKGKSESNTSVVFLSFCQRVCVCIFEENKTTIILKSSIKNKRL